MIVQRKVKHTPAREHQNRRPRPKEGRRVIDVSGRPDVSNYASTTHITLGQEPFPLEEIKE